MAERVPEVPSFQPSVIIPLYNKAPYIYKTICSALEQTREPLEVIVVDDGSTDKGASIVSEIADPRIRLIRQSNSGVSVARNTGIAAARGSHIAFLDADDLYRPGHLENLYELANTYPEAAMLCTGYRKVDASGQDRGESIRVPFSGAHIAISDFFDVWSKGAFTFTSAIALKSDAIREMDEPFPPREPLGEDQDLWFRVAEKGLIAFSKKCTVDYRIDVLGSATHRNIADQLLPSYIRLYQRTTRPDYPRHLLHGARKLFASHLLNVANARKVQGDNYGATQLLLDRRALANPFYWLRTLASTAMPTWRRTK